MATKPWPGSIAVMIPPSSPSLMAVLEKQKKSLKGKMGGGGGGGGKLKFWFTNTGGLHLFFLFSPFF